MASRIASGKFLIGLALFLLLCGVYIASPNATPFDSRWTVPTALSIVHEGNADLDEYLPVLEREHFYAIECVDAAKQRSYPLGSPADCQSGHYFNFYPVSVAAMAAPAVWAIEFVLKAGQPWFRPLSERMSTETRRRFLQGDLVSSSMLVELLVASVITAAAGVVMYAIAATVLPTGWAALVALLFGLCSPAWSTGSRALWQHGPSMLLLALALLLIVRGAESPRLVGLAGLPLAIAFFIRPTNVVPLVVLSAYVFERHRRQLMAFLAGMAPVVVLHTAYTLHVYSAWVSPYSSVSRPNAPGLSLGAHVFSALPGNLISPSRGLLVYVPLFLFCVVGLRLPDPQKRSPHLRYYLAAACVLHWLLISLYEDWWGGHSYGPRYFSDITPLFVYLLIPVVWSFARHGVRARPALAAGFFLLAGCSFLIHQQGAMNWACLEWNICPRNIRKDPWRVWDWSDPQFLRGLHPRYTHCDPS